MLEYVDSAEGLAIEHVGWRPKTTDHPNKDGHVPLEVINGLVSGAKALVKATREVNSLNGRTCHW